jgi:hypothetical protein
MSKRVVLLGLCLLSGSFTTGLFAQKNYNGQVNTITTAVPFLRISPDARSGAMGDVGIAISADPNAQYWNLAKIPFAEKKMGFSLTYTPWLKELVPDIFMAYVAGYQKFGKEDNQSISFSLRYFSLGDILYTDDQSNSLGTGKPREYSLDLGYSRKLSPYLSTGISLRYIHSNLITGISQTPGMDYKPGNAFAADLGVYYTKTNEITEFKSNTFSFGAVLSNIGSKISYNSTRRDFIPANLGLGVAYGIAIDEYNRFTIALDVNKLLVPTPIDTSSSPDEVKYYIPEKSVVGGMLSSFTDAPGGFKEELREFQVSIGAEYWYQNQFALRAGYFYEDKHKGDRKYFTVGVGLRYKVFQINGSYLVPSGSGINRNPLSNTFRFSLMFELDSWKNEDGESVL